MRSALSLAAAMAALCLSFSTLAQQPEAAKAADVPVRVVVLYSSGVGYFEHFGRINADASTELRFKNEQINDILKSLLLQDLDGGKINSVTYPSTDPVAKTLRSFQIDITENPPLAQLLNQLRGSVVSVAAAAEKLEGTVLGVEPRQKPAGENKTITVQVLNLLSGATIRSVELEQIRSLEIKDAQLQQELAKALAALAQGRNQDRKPVVINFTGQGERRVRIGYVTESPVWKTSYRLVLPTADDQKPKLQGWAIVENQTDSDWNNVQLSLVSGRPISFIMDLVTPLYIPRPVVQMELYASLRPRTYEDGLDGRADKDRSARRQESAPGAPPAMGGRPGEAGRAVDQVTGLLAEQEKLTRSIDPSASIASVASASKVGDLFQYTVGNVSLPRQRSAMIPIVADDVEVTRLSIYNASVLARHPLNGARMVNTTGKHLLQGPLTVLDDNAYAGDAQIDNVPPGQSRLLSYGIDLQILVDATKNTSNSTITTGRIVKGVMQITRKSQMTQSYTFENKGEKAKKLLIEHPISTGWKLIDTAKPEETTATHYRFLTDAAAGKGGTFAVKQEMVHGESFAILPADIGQVLVYSREGSIPQPVRDALIQAAKLKEAMVDTQRGIDERQRQVNAITTEQNRIRSNMGSVDKASAYYNRLLTKLNEQESQIEKLQQEMETLRETMQKQRRDLENYLSNLNVG